MDDILLIALSCTAVVMRIRNNTLSYKAEIYNSDVTSEAGELLLLGELSYASMPGHNFPEMHWQSNDSRS
jgi:hypothetical protein